ncbi:hypothetical protein AB0A76_02230 [Streptomyces exfoliatus]|uniref:VCBS repeat-containing protein n=1 Tax=Streptomyces exfoliatus TaxID=1905 RepID=A0ABV3CP93_STREX
MGAVLAATAVVPAAVPAAAAPLPTAVAGETGTQAVVPFPSGARVIGAGRTGFLSLGAYTTSGQSWTRYSDGSVTRFDDTEWVSPCLRRGRHRLAGGWGTYHRLTGGSDLTGDGRADLVAADKAGVLWLYRGTGRDTAPFAARVRIGGGWGMYDQLTAVGSLAGGPAGDLVARDRTGVLWLYLGKGDGTFAPRTRIGGGWSQYSEIVGIGDGVSHDSTP